MFVKEYLLKDKNERQKHLNLTEKCLERGGNSTNHRGVLAQFLGTNIYGKPADLCHACHNDLCSNPRHLYWGTRKENIQDSENNGTWKSVWQRTIDKYGYEEACKMQSRGNKSLGGKANAGNVKTKEHKENISKSLLGKVCYTDGKTNIRQHKDLPIPEGFRRGMTKSKRENGGMVDTLDSKSSGFGRGGSTPPSPTNE